MSKIAFVFPGQGAQKAGMGKDFYENSGIAKSIFDEASKALSLDMKELCFEKNDRLDQTEYTQAALVTTCLAMTRCLEDKGLHADVTAGLSLGEYCALAVAGGIDDIDAIRLVRKRGQFMEHAVPKGEGAMAAVLGLSADKILEIIEKTEDVYVANYNCPGQIVITGAKAAVEGVQDALKEAGAKRVLMLNVSGPFHSPLLAKAGDEMKELLEKTDLHELRIPYVTNVSAEYVRDIKNTKLLLAEQVCNSVLWEPSVKNMIADGVDTFIEIGPGKTLAGFIKKINKEVKIYNVSTWEDMDKVVEEITGEANGK